VAHSPDVALNTPTGPDPRHESRISLRRLQSHIRVHQAVNDVVCRAFDVPGSPRAVLGPSTTATPLRPASAFATASMTCGTSYATHSRQLQSGPHQLEPPLMPQSAEVSVNTSCRATTVSPTPSASLCTGSDGEWKMLDSNVEKCSAGAEFPHPSSCRDQASNAVSTTVSALTEGQFKSVFERERLEPKANGTRQRNNSRDHGPGRVFRANSSSRGVPQLLAQAEALGADGTLELGRPQRRERAGLALLLD